MRSLCNIVELSEVMQQIDLTTLCNTVEGSEVVKESDVRTLCITLEHGISLGVTCSSPSVSQFSEPNLICTAKTKNLNIFS